MPTLQQASPYFAIVALSFVVMHVVKSPAGVFSDDSNLTFAINGKGGYYSVALSQVHVSASI